VRRRFRIVAVPDPQTLPRIIGIFAQRSLIPSTMAVKLRGDQLDIETTLDDLDAPTSAMIAAKLAESVLVASVVCESAGAKSNTRPAPMPHSIAAA